MPDGICREENPVWVSGMVYVDALDVRTVHNERESKGLPAIECERCGGKYHPTLSADAYA